MTENEFEDMLNDPKRHCDFHLWHSSEPLRLDVSGTEIIAAGDGYPIATVCNEHGETSSREDRINARRFVTCYNFCAGLTNSEMTGQLAINWKPK